MSGQKTLRFWADKLAKKEVSGFEIGKYYLDEAARSDGAVKAFLKLDADLVLKQAAESDKRRAAGKALGPYDGIPVGLKDCISAAGETLSCASKMLENFVSPYDATVVTKLRAQGMVPFGRLNMDEFAMGSSCENSAFQKTANPHDNSRVPGGSSGGSAAAVAGSMVPAALGSDTGGSIRQPAAFCGIVGLKPTYGRVSRFGVSAFASSLDQVGPLTLDTVDAAIMLDIISGRDTRDSTALPLDPTAFADTVSAQQPDLKGMKIGLPKEYFAAGSMNTGVEKLIQQAIAKVKAMGAELVEVSLPHTAHSIAAYYVIATAEASANLGRIDGIRYGKRKPGKDMVDIYFKSRGEGFGDEVKRRILLGTYVLSSGYYDAYYLKAQKARTLIRRDFEEAAKLCDVLLTPTTPNVAFKFGEKSNPLEMYLSDMFTLAVNLAGNCAISVFAGNDEAARMPVGVQFIAPALEELKLLKLARAFELAQ